VIDIEKVKLEIVERLKPLNPDRVILFGSYAYGIPNEDSDIDLYVVTNDDFIPKTWEEKNKLYLKVSKLLRDLRDIIAIDLIVHSKSMYTVFKETNSSFFKNDIQKGLPLI
jgi:predicted nucleotidyltransferase